MDPNGGAWVTQHRRCCCIGGLRPTRPGGDQRVYFCTTCWAHVTRIVPAGVVELVRISLPIGETLWDTVDNADANCTCKPHVRRRGLVLPGYNVTT